MNDIDLSKLSLKELYTLYYQIQWEFIYRLWWIGLILIPVFIAFMMYIRRKL